MILHTFNQPGALSRHLALIQPDDAVLLIEDGVFDAPMLKALDCKEKCLLKRDLIARGLGEAQPNAIAISDAQWVALTIRCERVASWS